MVKDTPESIWKEHQEQQELLTEMSVTLKHLQNLVDKARNHNMAALIDMKVIPVPGHTVPRYYYTMNVMSLVGTETGSIRNKLFLEDHASKAGDGNGAGSGSETLDSLLKNFKIN